MTSTFSVVLAQSTIYWPPSSCLSGLTVQTSSVNDADTTTVYVFPGVNLLSGNDTTPTSCLPAPYVSALRSATPAINPVVSPAVACPVSYQPACSMVGAGAPVAAGASFEIWSVLNNTNTAIGCCPSNYQCASQSPYQCISTPSAGETIAATNTDGSIVRMTTNASFQVTATAVRFVYMLNSSNSDAAPFFYGQSKSLPVASIVIIVVVVFLVVLGCGACCFWHRKRSRQMREEKEKAKSDHEAAAAAVAKFDKPELDAGPLANTQGGDAPEVVTGPREVLSPVAELPAEEGVVEMPAGTRWKGKGIERRPVGGQEQGSTRSVPEASGLKDIDDPPPMASGAL